jgi:predicted RNA-binding Zn ribbon-like protein
MVFQMASNPAPGELELVRAFVNTWDADEDLEKVPGPDELRDWLAEHDLLDAGARVTPADHRHAIEVREALRAVLLANAGLDLDPAAAPVLDAAAQRARLGVRFDADGHVRTAPETGGVAGALGRLLAIVAAAQEAGTWPRLKACLADDCQWAFFDRSRNRSAVWCDMKICGNRQKVRSYRERHHRPHALHD